LLKDQKLSTYHKLRKIAQYNSRAAIEPIIIQVKFGYKMAKNYLNRGVGDKVNAIVAVAAINFRKNLNELPFSLKIYFKL
jgi:hypothetical protein